MIESRIINGREVKLWLPWDELDDHAKTDLTNLCSLPFIEGHIAQMPDAHAGRGCNIGTVVATRGYVILTAIGSDLGCGMGFVQSNIKASSITPEVLRKGIMRGIRKQIPLGDNYHKTKQSKEFMPGGDYYDKVLSKAPVCQRRYEAALKMIGTVGGGNHFLELQKDQDDNLCIMVHSGSRGLGGKIYETYAKMAEDFESWYFSSLRACAMGLPYLPIDSDQGRDYFNDMKWGLEFARKSRELMLNRIMQVIGDCIPGAEFTEILDMPHNFAAWENNLLVHRKGAAPALEGKRGIIPGSQGTNSYIVEGLGNSDSYCSSSHGAGRKLSRTAAVNELSLEDEMRKLDEKGIVHALRFKTDLEEAAGAYKDIKKVLEYEKDLVKPIIELSPIAVIKGV